jgi:prepilin-type N-terminal cleavage/methylation domain-containing protein
VRPLPTSRTHLRGFTLIELMVVVVIIAILAVIAVPSFTARFRQQRVVRAAQDIAEVYRTARTQALGRGSAVVVTYTPGANGTGRVDLLEGVEGDAAGTAAQRTGCGNAPSRGCITNDWSNILSAPNVGTARRIYLLQQPANVTTTAAVGTAAVAAGTPFSVCFSPGGRAYVNTVGTWTPASWNVLNTVLDLSVSGEGRTHRVVVLPNGSARLAL